MKSTDLAELDLSETIFFGEEFPQTGYDHSINEGFSSGNRRYATLDVTELTDEQIIEVLEGLTAIVKDYKVCKTTQLVGFNSDGKRYISISGVSHMRAMVAVKDMITERARSVTADLPVTYVQEHIPISKES